MKKYLMILAASLALAAAAVTASPAPQSQSNSPYQQNRGQQGKQNQHQQNQRNNRGQQNGKVKYDNRNRGNYVVHDRGRQGGWYKRGGRMPPQYRSNRYYVTDYRVYHLRQPPRGYRWVRGDNGDFLMVAVATGIIASIILGGH